jgi:predicted Zn-dependent protease
MVFLEEVLNHGELIIDSGKRMRTLARSKSISVLMLAAELLLVFAPTVPSSGAATLPSISLEGFRWNSFPARVLVDMNTWSTPDYAVAVREALDDWLRSIWNYTDSFNDTSLTMIRFAFYESDINRTDNYNVLVTFAASEINPPSETVGLTTARWNPQTHEPISPVTVNITTYSATASHLFVRNVAMHELGHALGLGHASPQNTLDGPELMYHISSRNSILFPSTLDVYGLTVLYRGRYDQTVQLPADIPHKMPSEGTVPPPTSDFWENLPRYAPLLAAIAIILVLVPILLKLERRNKPEHTAQEIPPPPDDAQASETSKENLN